MLTQKLPKICLHLCEIENRLSCLELEDFTRIHPEFIPNRLYTYFPGKTVLEILNDLYLQNIFYLLKLVYYAQKQQS